MMTTSVSTGSEGSWMSETVGWAGCQKDWVGLRCGSPGSAVTSERILALKVERSSFWLVEVLASEIVTSNGDE